MNILAVDDERLSLDILVEEIEKVFKGNTVTSFSDGGKAIEYIKELSEKGELLQYAFLDINLHDVTGIDIAKAINTYSPDAKVIFCTAYSEYAMQAYDVFANGYLMKPITTKEIEITLDEVTPNWREILVSE